MDLCMLRQSSTNYAYPSSQIYVYYFIHVNFVSLYNKLFQGKNTFKIDLQCL